MQEIGLHIPVDLVALALHSSHHFHLDPTITHQKRLYAYCYITRQLVTTIHCYCVKLLLHVHKNCCKLETSKI